MGKALFRQQVPDRGNRMTKESLRFVATPAAVLRGYCSAYLIVEPWGDVLGMVTFWPASNSEIALST